MPLKFSTFCSLLSELEDIETHDPPFIQAEKSKRLKTTTQDWFRAHRPAINELAVDGAVALLSALLPEWRTDRVYGFQAAGLCRTLGRLLSLGGARLRDLQAYKEPGRGDLAECLERVQRSGGALAHPALTLEEVDGMLENQASRSRFSDRAIAASTAEERNKTLGNVLFRASPVEAKWLVRLLLKDFSPVRIDQALVLKCFHFLLPDVLRFQRDFRAAVVQLRGPLSAFPASPDVRSESDYRSGAAIKLKPQVGIKVGRPDFTKCRGIDHCMRTVQDQRWVLERKYDGEYCEIHIDLTQPRQQWIKIFSKSSKDSTEDRKGLHETLIECLRLGFPNCKIQQHAILLGELVVYSDEAGCILPFEKIRKHVRRSGHLLGADLDSQAHSHEHLAIIFFDLLLLDDEDTMAQPVDHRRSRLREVYVKRRGRAMGAEWKVLDFSESETAKRRLVEQFAASIAQRCEGLVLKPLGVPYFALDDGSATKKQCIKLKKDYIDDMADEADFAVVGASYDAQIALKRKDQHLRWTSFHLACLTNKADVVRFDARPRLRYVATIEDESCIASTVIKTINSLGPFVAENYDPGIPNQHLDLEDIPRAIKVDTLFRSPFVFEVIGSGFDKPSNRSYFMLRHPRVKKLHEDRSWTSCISFQELQELATAARGAPEDSESQETRMWVEKLERSCRRKFAREQSAAQRCETSSPEKSSLSLTCRASAQKRSISPHVERDHVHVLDDSPGSDHATVSDTNKFKARRNAMQCDVHDGRPLSEITNQSRPRCGQLAQAIFGTKISAPKWPPIIMEPARTSAVMREIDLSAQCGKKCLFAGAVILLAPCVQGHLYVCEDLLPTHAAVVTQDLKHWQRLSFSHAQLASTVSESQSYPGMRKIVLVEAQRRAAVLELLESLRYLNGDCWKEPLEIYDWRALEQCTTHLINADHLEDHLIGAAVMDDTQKQAFLKLRAGWIQQV